MKFSLAATVVLVACSLAAPVTIPKAEYGFPNFILPRQTVGIEANEFKNGGCKDIVLLFARGSIQSGNMGSQPGPELASALKARLNATRVAAQGVPYAAMLLTNLASSGASRTEAGEFADLIQEVAAKCPKARIVVSGYSQGAALLHLAVGGLPAAVRSRIAAAVTFGDTQNEQDGGRVPGLPAAKTLIICNKGDLVCEGELMVALPHLDYSARVPEAVAFIAARVKAT
ncbi:cutinase [Gaeumannomyces tritici R3-111a-1]|uniref:Cutinase n=1 Tax=Gaeumannomyces tritici (strain R3-111a-1) TaxID=644352 RepID=J3P200_GAET3|nr:cutinase [Gaeumannomyces tritici R3-111a-1]EJT73692.1 cutinase [Gaeumannomyces tritici R3-111a-1]